MTPDLSRTFGQPLTSSLRGLLPPRPVEHQGVEEQGVEEQGVEEQDLEEQDLEEQDLEEQDLEEQDLGVPTVEDPVPGAPAATTSQEAAMARHEHAPPAPGQRTNGVGRRGASIAAARTPPMSAGTNRRWGTARVASREHVDLLVLLALERGAGDGRAVIKRLRTDSGGVLDAPERTVHRTLHRLTRNRLLVRRVDPASGRPSYSLTETGQRSTRARVREWRALTRAVESILSEDNT